MSLLTVKDIHVTVGDRHLLRGVDLVVGDGQPTIAARSVTCDAPLEFQSQEQGR